MISRTNVQTCEVVSLEICYEGRQRKANVDLTPEWLVITLLQQVCDASGLGDGSCTMSMRHYLGVEVSLHICKNLTYTAK